MQKKYILLHVAAIFLSPHARPVEEEFIWGVAARLSPASHRIAHAN